MRTKPLIFLMTFFDSSGFLSNFPCSSNAHLDGADSFDNDLQSQYIGAVTATANVQCNDSQNELDKIICKCDFFSNQCLNRLISVYIYPYPKSTDSDGDTENDMMVGDTNYDYDCGDQVIRK